MKKFLLISAILFSTTYFVNAQGKIINSIRNVKNKTQEVKSTVDIVKPEQKKEEPKPNTQPTTTAQDTGKKTTNTTTTGTTSTTGTAPTTGTTDNLAIGDQGTNNNEKKGNTNQVKNFVKGSKDNGTKDKPYNNGTTPTSNLAIGDQGAVEEKGGAPSNKNAPTNTSNQNVAPQPTNTNTTTITPK